MKIEYLNEIWKDIKGYEGLYQVSNFGRVRNKNYKNTGKIRYLKPFPIRGGYLMVNLSNNGIYLHFLIHRLVAFAFPEICGQYFEGAECEHINCIRNDNRAINLRWVTHKTNCCNPLTIINYSNAKTGIQINGKCSKNILQFDLDGNFIKEWPSSMEIYRTLGFNRSSICKCCRGESRYKSPYGYIWKYKD